MRITSSIELRKTITKSLDNFDEEKTGHLDQLDFKKFLKSLFLDLNFPGIVGDWQ